MKTVDIIYRYEARDTPARPRPLDSNAALGRLNNGNRAFAALLDDPTDEHVERIISVDLRDLALGDTSLPKQRPFAAVLGCSDARVPVELIFNEGPNDLFVIRVAGEWFRYRNSWKPEICRRQFLEYGLSVNGPSSVIGPCAIQIKSERPPLRRAPPDQSAMM